MLFIYSGNQDLVLVPPAHVEEHREHPGLQVAGVPGVRLHVVVEDRSGLLHEGWDLDELDGVATGDVGIGGFLEDLVLLLQVVVELLQVLQPLSLHGDFAGLDGQG